MNLQISREVVFKHKSMVAKVREDFSSIWLEVKFWSVVNTETGITLDRLTTLPRISLNSWQGGYYSWNSGRELWRQEKNALLWVTLILIY